MTYDQYLLSKCFGNQSEAQIFICFLVLFTREGIVYMCCTCKSSFHDRFPCIDS